MPIAAHGAVALLCLQAAEFGGFLRSLLVYNPDQRPTAAAALKHPWLVLPLDPQERERHLQEQQQQQKQAAAGQQRKRRWWPWSSKGVDVNGGGGTTAATPTAQAA